MASSDAFETMEINQVGFRQNSRWWNWFRQNWVLYLMILPGLILLILFTYYPMYGLVVAFQRFNPGLGFIGSPWVGLKHFEKLFSSPAFLMIIRNTMIIAVGKLVLTQLCAIALALLLNEVRRVAFKRTIQTFVYLPHFLSWIVLGGIIIDLLSQNGLVNRALFSLGIKPILFLASNQWFVPTLFLTHLWQELGWSAIIYLAALTGVDPQLYEVAAIDGANRWQQTWNISIPGIRTVIIVVAALNLGNVLNAGFDQVFALYNPSVYATGDIIDTWVYRQGIVSANYSLATAAGLFKSVVSFLLISLGYLLAYKWGDYKLF